GGTRGVLGPVLGADHREVVAVPPGGAADGGLSAGGARGAAGGAGVHGGQEVPRQSARPALRGGPPGSRGAGGGGRSAAGGGRGGAAAGAAGGGGAGAAAGGDAGSSAARALSAVSGHDGQRLSVHRAVRHGVGDHLGLPGDRPAGLGEPGGGGAGHLRGADRDGGGARSGDPGGHGLQLFRQPGQALGDGAGGVRAGAAQRAGAAG